MSTKRALKGPSYDSESKSGKSQSVMKTVKGRPPVDPEALTSVGADNYIVYVDSTSGDVYDVLLNQTNVAQNNNKYYVIQLLESSLSRQYWCWTRWGRVGYKGQHSLTACGADLAEAKRLFESKFSQKTNNLWEERHDFHKFPGKYDMVLRDYGKDESSSDEENITSRSIKKPKSDAKTKLRGIKKEQQCKVEPDTSDIPSKLDVRVQNVIQMICDIRNMEEVIVSMNYDVEKAPLGKLTKVQLKAGYDSLKKIADILGSTEKKSQRQISRSRRSVATLSSQDRKKLIEACNEFYTRIPHCFGMRPPIVIDSREELKNKLELLETLGEIQIAIEALKSEPTSVGHEHIIDTHYKNLNCIIRPVEKTDANFDIVRKYLTVNHAPTHNTYQMELEEVFETSRSCEEEIFTNDIGQNVLLWHGSRLTNVYGILSQGLRIAPPEAPVTGYMFGKGVYFADCASKSANYCQASQMRNVGFLLLCKVALGTPLELTQANYKADELPIGYTSVKVVVLHISDNKLTSIFLLGPW